MNSDSSDSNNTITASGEERHSKRVFSTPRVCVKHAYLRQRGFVSTGVDVSLDLGHRRPADDHRVSALSCEGGRFEGTITFPRLFAVAGFAPSKTQQAGLIPDQIPTVHNLMAGTVCRDGAQNSTCVGFFLHWMLCCTASALTCRILRKNSVMGRVAADHKLKRLSVSSLPEGPPL